MALIYIYSIDNFVRYDNIVDNIIILSPSMYWFKPCTIPTKNILKAKKIALHMMSEKPNSFNEVLLYKKENVYDAYAYSSIDIKKFLTQHSIINPKIYFANQLNLESFVKIDEEKVIYCFNDRVMEKASSQDETEVSIENVYESLLEGEKYLSGFEKNDTKSTILLLVSLGLFFMYIILTSINNMKTSNNLEEQLSNLKTDDRSFYEIKSLIKKYKKLDKQSTNVKKKVSKALSDKNLQTLSYEKGSIKVSHSE